MSLNDSFKESPWYKCSRLLELKEGTLNFHIPHDVFSTDRIDEGTRLLLDHLPAGNPESVLDMGCGYGALGLSIAKKYPKSTVTMIDRDTLAVEWSILNARQNGLSHVAIRPGLGFQEIGASDFSWIVCNVPARIGASFIKTIFEQSTRHLRGDGELRMVVIHDIVPMVTEVARDMNVQCLEIKRGTRHTILSITRKMLQNVTGISASNAEVQSSRKIYLRDEVNFLGLTYLRPTDFGGDDPKRLKYGLPLLSEVLPKRFSSRALLFRSGYGILSCLFRMRWPSLHLTVFERDLLAIEFIKLNHLRHFSGEIATCDIQPHHHWPLALNSGDCFDLICGELSPSAGKAVALEEIQAVQAHLSRTGHAYLLCLEKSAKEWLSDHSLVLSARDGYAVLRLVQA